MPFETKDKKSINNAYNCKSLTFIENTEKVKYKTGEIYYLYKRKYLNLTFTFRLDGNKEFEKLTVRGSIHTFSNKGVHNANILTFEYFVKYLNKYVSLFGINLQKCVLLPPENGTSIFLNEFNTTFKDYDIIDNTFCVKRILFAPNRGVQTSLISGTSSTELRTKVYSKSSQSNFYKYCDNALRIEDKPTKSRGLKKKGIILVSDLYDINNHIILLEWHLENMSKIVLYDYTIKVPKNSKYVKDIKELRHQSNWKKIIKECRNKEVYNTKYNDKVALLNMLSKKYGSNILQKLIEYTKNQTLKALGLCSFNEYKIMKIPKNAQLIKPKNAQLYIGCNLCTAFKEKTLVGNLITFI